MAIEDIRLDIILSRGVVYTDNRINRKYTKRNIAVNTNAHDARWLCTVDSYYYIMCVS